MKYRELERAKVLRHVSAGIVTGATLAAIGAVLIFAPVASAEKEAKSWFERIDFNGDFRARDEVFVIDGMKDRHRLRYRLRLGADTEVNDHIAIGFRLATGSDANEGNQTLGDGQADRGPEGDEQTGIDFDPDGIFIDRAFLILKPQGNEKPMFGDSFDITIGKMPNPFQPKGIGPSLLLWDGDQMPEGVALSWGASPRDYWTRNLDVAYFVLDDNSDDSSINPSRDPAMIAVQMDEKVKLNDQVQFKSQVTYYAIRKLTNAYLRTVSNTDGLTSNNHLDLIEFHGGTTWAAHKKWPVTVWGNFVYNASAVGIGEGKQNMGFGVGIEAGNKGDFVNVGAAYFELEADAVPSSLYDSDVFDGGANGKTWLVYATKQMWTNTDIDVRAYFTDQLDKDVTALGGATPNDRIRIQTSIIVKF
jgi:hypothetical protein